MQTITGYVYDSETEIIQKRSLKELDNWISHINYIIEESDNLAKVASNKIKNRSLRDCFLLMIEKNIELLSKLHNVRNETEKLNECDDLECDMVYLREHENTRFLYLNHVNSYRNLKKEVYLSLLTQN